MVFLEKSCFFEKNRKNRPVEPNFRSWGPLTGVLNVYIGGNGGFGGYTPVFSKNRVFRAGGGGETPLKIAVFLKNRVIFHGHPPLFSGGAPAIAHT